jgi:hypothetical protein
MQMAYPRQKPEPQPPALRLLRIANDKDDNHPETQRDTPIGTLQPFG